MQGRFSRIGVAAVVFALAGAVVVQEHRVNEARARASDLALQQENRAAAADTTRDVAIESPKVAQLLGDLHLMQRAVVQIRQEKDALSAALGTERIANAGLSLSLDSLQRTVASHAGTTEDSSTRVRRADFDIRQAPYTVAAAVELPPAPDTGRMDLRIALDQISVVARLSCAPPNADGIRPASIEATTPPWASLKFNDVQQSPDLCRSPALEAQSARHWRPAVLIGVGVVSASTNELQLGGFAGVGFSYGR